MHSDASGFAGLERVCGRAAPGRAGTRIRSEAPHRILTIGRPAADRAGARPYHPIDIAIICETVHQGLFAEARSSDRATAPIQDYPVQLTIILDSSGRN